MMKRAFHIVFGAALSGFRFYRRWIGGTWYYVGDTDESSGIAGPVLIWVQQIEDWQKSMILETEHY